MSQDMRVELYVVVGTEYKPAHAVFFGHYSALCLSLCLHWTLVLVTQQPNQHPKTDHILGDASNVCAPQHKVQESQDPARSISKTAVCSSDLFNWKTWESFYFLRWKGLRTARDFYFFFKEEYTHALSASIKRRRIVSPLHQHHPSTSSSQQLQLTPKKHHAFQPCPGLCYPLGCCRHGPEPLQSKRSSRYLYPVSMCTHPLRARHSQSLTCAFDTLLFFNSFFSTGQCTSGGGSYDSNLCPWDPPGVKCCTYGGCTVSDQNNRGGSCVPAETCTRGTLIPNRCKGGNDIQCCVTSGPFGHPWK